MNTIKDVLKIASVIITTTVTVIDIINKKKRI